jgi:hypothetical protein
MEPKKFKGGSLNYVANPNDGRKPYAISPAYVRQNYELV